MKKVLVLLTMLVTLSSSAFGFATIMTSIKGGDTITFNSNVNDVDVYLNGNKIGKKGNNSYILKVKRSGTPQIFTFKKAGYKTVEIQLTTEFDQMFWGNFFVGGSFGSSTDSWFTSNSQEYSPSQYFIEMERA